MLRNQTVTLFIVAVLAGVVALVGSFIFLCGIKALFLKYVLETPLDESRQPGPPLIIGGMMGGGAWLALLFIVGAIFKKNWLRKNGQSVTGVVTRLAVSYAGNGMRSNYDLHFAFLDGMGRKHEDLVGLFPGQAGDWKEGDPITIYYDPKKPEDCIADVDK